jgi:tetratricopeptide (TPR) repeat protein
MNRKSLTQLSFAALLALPYPVYAQPAPDALKSIQSLMQQKKYAEAVGEAEGALANGTLTAPEKVRLLKAAADASLLLGKNGVPEAMAFHERIVSDPAMPNGAKIEALNNMANAYIASLSGLELGRMNLDKAHAILKRGLELPGLTPEDRALALKNIGRLYERQDLNARARETYQQILTLNAGERTNADAQRLIAGTYVNEGREEDAVAIYKQFGWDLVGLYQGLGDAQRRDAEITKQLGDPDVAENTRWLNFSRFPIWDGQGKSLDQIRQSWDAYMPAFLEKDPNRALVLQRKVVAKEAEPTFVAWAAPIVLAAPKIAPNDFVTTKTAYIESLAALSKTDEVVREARELAADTRTPSSTKLWAQLVAATIKSNNGAGAVLSAAGNASNQEKAGAIPRAAQTVLRAGNEKAARDLYQAYQSLLAKPDRASITCSFVDKAPYDVGSWLDSPLVKTSGAKLNRPYGDNLKFLLETDSALTGRNTTADTKPATGDTSTDFYTACDAEGIHFFFNASDSRVKEVVDGLLGGGSFEMYLAPGEQQAYYTFLTEMPRGGINPADFVTMYPNAQFRMPSEKDGSLRTETRPTETGFATQLSLTWDVFYDKLPAAGTRWQFEAIRWTRSGGFSFGGSESVHNRSSFGDIVFSGLTPEHLNAIKRGIVLKAVAKYKQAKRITGAIGSWPDSELGDPVFYQTQVEPMVKKLDEYAERVNKDMTAADVDLLFREAVPGWMDGEYQIAALRRQYLEKELLAENRG